MVKANTKKSSGIKVLLPKIKAVLERNGAKRAGLFGSYARGENRKGSDIDILVELGPSESLFDLIGIEQELEHATKRKFGLITYRSLNHLIRESVLRQEVKIL